MIDDEGNSQQPKSPTAQRSEVLAEFARHIQKVPASVATALRAIMQRTKNMSGPSYDRYNDAIRVFAKFLVKVGSALVRITRRLFRLKHGIIKTTATA